MSRPHDRPAAKEASADLLVLEKWEGFTGWFLDHTARWPKCVRFTLTQRLENHALDVLEMLVQARYETRRRRSLLRKVNLLFERMRHLLRIAKSRNVSPRRGFEAAMRSIDETGRMVHGWRKTLGERDSSDSTEAAHR